jgi:transketolase
MTALATRVATWADALAALCEQRDDVLVLSAENHAPLRGLAPRLGERFIDVGIAEQTLVGAAAGLALRGRRPVVHALAAFLTMRAFEFIRTDVALARLPVTLVGYIPGALSEANGPTHQALEDLALMRAVPGLRVYCPADGEELAAALPDLVTGDGPCYVRFIDSPALRPAPPRLVRSELLAPGAGGVSLLTCGALLREALRARALLESHGVPVRLVHLPVLAPLDVDAVLAAARCELLVTLEDHFLVGGLWSAVAEVLARAGRACRVLPLGFEQRHFRPARLSAVLEAEGLSGPRVAQRVLDELRRPPAEGARACPIE